MDRRWLQRAGALALVLAVALATARPSRAQTPPLDTLVEQIPSSAVAVRLSTLDLDGYADAALGYALNMSVDLAWDGSQQTIQQQSFALYRYDGAEWRSIFDGNAFGLHLFRTVLAAGSSGARNRLRAAAVCRAPARYRHPAAGRRRLQCPLQHGLQGAGADRHAAAHHRRPDDRCRQPRPRRSRLLPRQHRAHPPRATTRWQPRRDRALYPARAVYLFLLVVAAQGSPAGVP
jgi:hypothetical protein